MKTGNMPPTLLDVELHEMNSKSYQDTKPGDLERWPAHASKTETSGAVATITRDKRLRVIEESYGQQRSPTKPKFLEQLEAFVERELRGIRADEQDTNELRLQVYREVFEHLIEEFKTYRPLLAAIKNEYEVMLEQQTLQIQRMLPLEQMLVTISEHCDQKIINLREEEKQEVIDLKVEIRRLHEHIERLINEHDSKDAQIERLKDELSVQYEQFRNESDARKLLVADVNELRYLHEELMAAKQPSQSPETDEDNIMNLKIFLKKAREGEAEASRKLNEMIANYGDVIPRRDFDALTKHSKNLEEAFETVKDDFRKLQVEHETLLDIHKQVLQQRDDYFVELETLKRSATPRPDWDRCMDFITGGEERWKQLSAGKCSNDLVDLLLDEIQGKSLDGQVEYFDGLGLGDDVAKYLQYEGQVRNRRISKRDCALLVHDIWRQKTTQDAEREDGSRDKLVEFVHNYLRQRFGLEQMIVEWGYNLRDACQRYGHDEHIGLFYSVLTNEADEELYHGFLQEADDLLNRLTEQDELFGNQGSLSKDDFRDVLTDFFKLKDAESIQALVDAAVNELRVEDMDPMYYKDLFMEDDEGDQGPFLQELKRQSREYSEKYVEDIAAGLDDTNPISVSDLKQAILTTDPEVTEEILTHCLCWAYQVENADGLSKAEPRTKDELVRLLQKCYISRSGVKP